MRIDWHTLALQAVNFGILIWLLQRFLYRPVLRLVDARRAHIEQQYGDARQAAADAKQQLAAIESQHASLASERAHALATAAAEADKMQLARRQAAEQEAAALLDDARKTLASEREQALGEARQAALDLAAELTRRLLADLSESLQTEPWLEGIERHLAALPESERVALTRQPSSETALRVVTAHALSPTAEESSRERLARALGGAAIAFEVDPALGAGAELHFPGAILRFSLRSAVSALRAELDRHAAAAEHD